MYHRITMDALNRVFDIYIEWNVVLSLNYEINRFVLFY